MEEQGRRIGTKRGPMGSRGRENILGKSHIREKRGGETNGPTGELELGYICITGVHLHNKYICITVKELWEEASFPHLDLKEFV